MPTLYPSQVPVEQLALVSEGWGTHTRSRDTVCTSRVPHTVPGAPSVQQAAPLLLAPSDLVRKKTAVCTAGVARKVTRQGHIFFLNLFRRVSPLLVATGRKSLIVSNIYVFLRIVVEYLISRDLVDFGAGS